MGVPFILIYYYSETTRSAFFARGTRERVCGSVDSINDSMCQQEYRRWLGSIDTCLRIQRHMHNAHLYTTRLDTTSSLGTSALRSSSFTTVPCALPGRHNTFLKLNNLGFTNVAGAPWLRYICDACMDGLTIFVTNQSMMDKEILEEKTTNSVPISITGLRKTKYFIILIIPFIADDPQSGVRSKATSSLKDWKNGGKKLSASMRSFRTITKAPQYYSVFTHALVRGPGISFAANETLIGYVSVPYFDNLLISNVF